MSALNMVFGHFYASAFSENTVEGRIFGGNDQLPKRFAKVIASNLKYNCPVKKISHSKSGVEVTFEESGKLTAMSADRCVVAMPLTILRKTKITPYFSDEKMHCIRKQSYGEVMKIAMQFKRRIWDEQGSVGQRVFTDTPLRRVYHFSIDQPGPRGILLSFTSGSSAAKLGKMSQKQRLRVAKETATELWSETPYAWESGISKYWNEDPWMQGSYTYVSPGQWDFIDILAQPEDKVHFAGEHTSEFHSSMNGAIESGVRASKEIIKG
jgi:monoamine oxidase